MTPILTILYVFTFLVMFTSAAVLLRRRYTGGRFETELRRSAPLTALPADNRFRERDHTLAA